MNESESFFSGSAEPVNKKKIGGRRSATDDDEPLSKKSTLALSQSSRATDCAIYSLATDQKHTYIKSFR